MSDIRVVMCDDHLLFRQGLKSLLQGRGFQVVGEASSGAPALELVREHRPDVVLMDLAMPGVGGLEATRLLKAEYPEVPVVVLTASEEEDDLFDAVKAGAQGYLLKNLDADEFTLLLAGAARGEAAITPQLACKILAEFARIRGGGEARASTVDEMPAMPPDADALTFREQEVLELLVEGAPNKEIANRLTISENTVKYHLRNILEKLHLHNRAQVVAYALSHGLVRPGS